MVRSDVLNFDVEIVCFDNFDVEMDCVVLDTMSTLMGCGGVELDTVWTLMKIVCKVM